jgi:hypothetical protein
MFNLLQPEFSLHPTPMRKSVSPTPTNKPIISNKVTINKIIINKVIIKAKDELMI